MTLVIGKGFSEGGGLKQEGQARGSGCHLGGFGRAWGGSQVGRPGHLGDKMRAL